MHFCRYRRFAGALFPVDRWIDRELAMLRIHDGRVSGASQREFATVPFRAERVAHGWEGDRTRFARGVAGWSSMRAPWRGAAIAHCFAGADCAWQGTARSA